MEKLGLKLGEREDGRPLRMNKTLNYHQGTWEELEIRKIVLLRILLRISFIAAPCAWCKRVLSPLVPFLVLGGVREACFDRPGSLPVPRCCQNFSWAAFPGPFPHLSIKILSMEMSFSGLRAFLRSDFGKRTAEALGKEVRRWSGIKFLLDFMQILKSPRGEGACPGAKKLFLPPHVFKKHRFKRGGFLKFWVAP